ncbi:carbonic anhydrase 15 isoform X3 [Mus caroli]|uniref:Carbonic anhydrase 15 isoform X3 n=1 Tax=Mus caroli TaxID=10089 RepID=A0A6P7QI05_MUSCR|nr:carbonic anhydrase 15 isoform X3 [Mus caroli]
MWALDFLLSFLLIQLAAQVDSSGTWCYDSQDPKCDLPSRPLLQTLVLVFSGPAHWKELAPACGGPTQSPINIDLRLVQRDYTLKPFIFQGYDSAPQDPWILENDGHTVLLRVNSCQQNCPAIQGAGLPSPEYRLLQLHFHWGSPGHQGSEHSLDEKHGSMEEEDRDNTNFSAIVSGLKTLSSPGVAVNLTSTFALASLLPSALGLLRYYRYSGSLTTPGCEPAVLWTVFENTVPIGRAQVVQFQAVLQTGPPGLHPRPLTDNFRPQQPLGERRITASPEASIRSSVSTLPCLHLALVGLGVGLWLWQGP